MSNEANTPAAPVSPSAQPEPDYQADLLAMLTKAAEAAQAELAEAAGEKPSAPR